MTSKDILSSPVHGQSGQPWVTLLQGEGLGKGEEESLCPHRKLFTHSSLPQAARHSSGTRPHGHILGLGFEG